MARPLRIEFPNAYYHVSNCGEDNRRIFPSEKYVDAFISSLREACERLNVQVHAYCLLKNEYHLLIKTPEGNLSRFMRQVDGLYTQHYQRLKKAGGSVFRARYKAVLVQAENYLLKLSRFFHCLPGGPKKTTAYPWSSYELYTNKVRPEPWFERSEVLEQLGPGARPYVRYGKFVEEGIDAELKHFYGKKNLLSILGDDKFKHKVRKHASPTAARGVSRGSEARQRPPIKEVVTVVAAHFKVEERSIYKAARGPGSKNVPRWVAMYLCQEVSGVTLQTIARRFGLKRYGTVSTTIGKLKVEVQEDSRLQTAINKIKAKLKK